MRLINVKTLKLEEFHDKVPPYAILSHTWGNDDEELTFRDVQDGKIEKPGIGSAKFRGCCQQAVVDKLKYAWIDTCCIDKTNQVELGEAINSMFRWYNSAAICYAFLSDVPADDNPRKGGSKFQNSRWFKRGWTLQELIAPKTMRFYGIVATPATHTTQAVQEWRLLGTKGNMSAMITSITGIPRAYLLGIAQIHSASVAQRMSWAADRDTKRKEDLAYCLLGIFNITMPMIYGEGGEKAFFRLQEQIMIFSSDDSILAWGLGTDDDSSANNTGNATAGRVLARAPGDFANSRHIIRRVQSLKYTSLIDMHGGSIRANLSLLTTSAGQTVGLLNCGPENNAQLVVGIPLIKSSEGSSEEYARPRGYGSSLHSATVPATMPPPIRIKHDTQEGDSADSDKVYFHYEDDDFTDINLEIIEVEPKSCWDEESALFMAIAATDNDDMEQILIRLRHKDNQVTKDFVVILEYGYKSIVLDILADCYVLICSSDLSLEELAKDLPSMMRKLDGIRRAKNELLSLRITMERDEGQPIFFLRPEEVVDEIFTTIDATAELTEKKLIRESLQLLDKNEAVEREDRELQTKMKEYNKKLRQNRLEQEEIATQMKDLKERQKALVLTEKEYMSERSEFDAKQSETKRELYSLSTKWKNIQKQWDELGQVDKIAFPLEHRTGLEWAATKGLVDEVKQRLEGGADVNARDQDGYTPLITASLGGQLEVAKLLIEHKAELDARADEGATSLFAAAASGSVELVEFLLDARADIEGVGISKAPPLMAAASAGYPDVIRLLLDRGAQIDARAEEDLTALLVASEEGKTDVVQLLLERGADVEAVSKDSITSLMVASGEGYIDIVRLLLDKGADMEAKNDNGATALVAAFDGGKKDVIRLLVERGAEVDLRDQDGTTMLIGASAEGLTEIVRQLLEIGRSDLHARGKEGRTALEWATKNGHEAIVQLLRDAEKVAN